MKLERTEYWEKEAVIAIRTDCYIALCRVWGIYPTTTGCQRYIRHLIFRKD